MAIGTLCLGEYRTYMTSHTLSTEVDGREKDQLQPRVYRRLIESNPPRSDPNTTVSQAPNPQRRLCRSAPRRSLQQRPIPRPALSDKTVSSFHGWMDGSRDDAGAGAGFAALLGSCGCAGTGGGGRDRGGGGPGEQSRAEQSRAELQCMANAHGTDGRTTSVAVEHGKGPGE